MTIPHATQIPDKNGRGPDSISFTKSTRQGYRTDLSAQDSAWRLKEDICDEEDKSYSALR